MSLLYFDCFSGIAGDMVIGALIHAGADPVQMEKELKKLNIANEYNLSWQPVIKNGISAMKFDVQLTETHHHHDGEHEHSHRHEHDHDHENIHSAEHAHNHNHEHEHGHHHEHEHHHEHHHDHENIHSVEHAHNHDHEHEHGHHHEREHHHEHHHDHENIHSVEHAHNHDHEHEHGHHHEREHHHEHHHDHENIHSVEHAHNHDHEHEHDHHHDHDHDHSHHDGHHHHHHGQRNYQEIVQLIEKAGFSASVKEMALKIFKKIGEAEGRIHGIPLEKVHFHEVGAVDSIIDIVGTAILLDQLNITSIKASPIAVGTGKIKIDHGIYPVPAPATLEILRGVPIYGGEIRGELTTPTGAGIVSVLADEFISLPAMNVQSVGYGAGTKTFKDHPNVLRVLIGE